jgi:hypothetical protein
LQGVQKVRTKHSTIYRLSAIKQKLSPTIAASASTDDMLLMPPITPPIVTASATGSTQWGSHLQYDA